MTITKLLQNAIRESGVSRYRISKETGIGQDVLCRFMQGKTGLSISSVDKVLDALGLEVEFRLSRVRAARKGE
jgi:hypothetical protein